MTEKKKNITIRNTIITVAILSITTIISYFFFRRNEPGV